MFKKNSISQGDSLELLKKIPNKSIDLVFADPPYNLQLRDTLYRPDQTTVEAVTNDWDKFDTYQAYDEFCLVWLKECKRVPRINPPPVEFAELINMCMKLGVISSASFDGRDFDPKISYWTELKEKYMKENPDIITLDNYEDKK